MANFIRLTTKSGPIFLNAEHILTIAPGKKHAGTDILTSVPLSLTDHPYKISVEEEYESIIKKLNSPF